MPAERFFSSQELLEDASMTILDQEFHHLVNVMRVRTGETIEIVNGRGQVALAVVVAIEKKRATLSIQKVTTEPLPTRKIILAQAIPRPNRLEFILEKGTELGMTEIWLFPSTHSERKDFSESQMQRFEGITIAALKQCGRLYLPKILLKPPLKEWTPLPSPAFFGDVAPSAPWMPEAIHTHTTETQFLVCIGPESGFTEEESTLLRKLGAKGVKLNQNILRTDTAAIVALAFLSGQP